MNTFNADRLTAALCGLKHETDSGYQIGAQESAALAGGRRPASRSLAGDCFTYAGLERDSGHPPRCNGAFAGACPHSRGFMSSPDRPYATLPDDALADEIAYQREIISHAAPKYIRPAQAKLAELLGEAGHREWLRDGVPW